METILIEVNRVQASDLRREAALQDFAATERSIRHRLRSMVAHEMKYLTRGRRGEGHTRQSILIRIGDFRRDHTASIRREREEVAA